MSFLNKIFGAKPKVPKLEELSPAQVQKDAVAGNLEVLPEAEKLTSQVNLFSRGEIDKMLAAAGGASLLPDSAAQIEKMIAGELPLSDAQASHLNSVAKSFGSGTAGSSSMGNLVARDLGLKTLDVISKGLSSAESWLRTTASLYEPTMMNVQSMFLTPQQQYQMQNEQNIQQFQRNWMKSQIDASPDPVLAAINAEIMQLATSFVGSLGPGGGGGGSVSARQFQQDYSGLNDTVQPGMDWGGNFDTVQPGMNFGG